MWTSAYDDRIRESDIHEAKRLVEGKLDGNFFRVRLDRTTPFRANLVDKGLLYTPEHGYAAFTVPHFDRFLRRTIPELTVPPVGGSR